LIERALEREMGPRSVRRLAQAVTDSVFSMASVPFSLNRRERELLTAVLDRSQLVDELYTDYPLIYITGPDPQDVHLTVSQINTHKIRGASTVVVAEDHPALKQAASKAPADNPEYRSVYVSLPRTNDTLLTVFSSIVVLQRLALRMSELKKQYLDRIGIKSHGVHPDVPKNVSKSITVD
jgi:predicted HAD superfamily Cof-like phosphohydrolase